MPKGVEYPGCYILDKLIYVTGGAWIEDEDLKTTDMIQIYDIVDKSWKYTEIRLPNPVFCHISIPLDSAHALIFGGASQDSEEYHETLLVSQHRFDDISEIPYGVSCLCPNYALSFENSIFTINDRHQLLIFNRSKRDWKICNFDLN